MRITKGSKLRNKAVSGGSATMIEDIKLSRAAYGGMPVEGYTIDKELSNKNYTTYVDPQGKATVVYRGTDPWNWRDVTTDMALPFLGVQHASKLSRFKNARKVAERAKAKHGAENVTLTGHSLGASQAMAVSNQTGLNARTFNPYVSPGDAMWNKKNYDKVENHYHKNDPISFFSRYMKRLKGNVTSRKKTKDPHGLSAISGGGSPRMTQRFTYYYTELYHMFVAPEAWPRHRRWWQQNITANRVWGPRWRALTRTFNNVGAASDAVLAQGVEDMKNILSWQENEERHPSLEGALMKIDHNVDN